MKLGWVLQYRHNHQLELGRIYSWSSHRIFVVTLVGKPKRRCVPKQNIQRWLMDSPNIEELLTHPHVKMRNLGLKLLERQNEREASNCNS